MNIFFAVVNYTIKGGGSDPIWRHQNRFLEVAAGSNCNDRLKIIQDKVKLLRKEGIPRTQAKFEILYRKRWDDECPCMRIVQMEAQPSEKAHYIYHVSVTETQNKKVSR